MYSEKHVKPQQLNLPHHQALKERFEQLRAQKAMAELTGNQAIEQDVEQQMAEVQVLWIKGLLGQL